MPVGDVGQFGWLLSRFTKATAGVVQTVAVSSDGRLVAVADGVTRSDARRLAVVTTAMRNLAEGVGGACAAGAVEKVIVDLDRGYLFINAINPHCLLGIVAGGGTDLADLAYDITVLINQVGPVVTPDLIDSLASALAADD